MTPFNTPEHAATWVLEAVASSRAISYATDMGDTQHPEIRWAIFGLPDTNEIAVVVQVGELRLGKAARSTLLLPSMNDRIFGIDVSDQALAVRLTDELWSEHSEQLIRAALRRRGH